MSKNAIDVQRYETGEEKYKQLSEENKMWQQEYLEIANRKGPHSGIFNGVMTPRPDFDILYYLSIQEDNLVKDKNEEIEPDEEVKGPRR